MEREVKGKKKTSHKQLLVAVSNSLFLLLLLYHSRALSWQTLDCGGGRSPQTELGLLIHSAVSFLARTQFFKGKALIPCEQLRYFVVRNQHVPMQSRAAKSTFTQLGVQAGG